MGWLCSIYAGVTDTPLIKGAAQGGEDGAGQKWMEDLKARIPMRRIAQPTDIADVILFLLSDSASFMTGQVVPVNGGSD